MITKKCRCLGVLGIAVAFVVFTAVTTRSMAEDQPSGVPKEQNSIRSTRQLKNVPPRKLDLLPVPTMEPTVRADCRQSSRIEELKKKMQNETDPQIRERDLLLLAGKFVGQDDWEAARKIYQELQAKSNDPAVIEAVKRNLEVVDRKLAILAETNPSRKETLELELANLHRELGHERASRRIYRRLAKTAKEPTVRFQAKELLSTKSKPRRLPVPIKLKQLEQTESQIASPGQVSEGESLQEEAQ